MSNDMRLGLLFLVLGLAAFFIPQMRSVRLFFLRRTHKSIIKKVEREMKAKFGDAYMPDPLQAERLWRKCLQIHELE